MPNVVCTVVNLLIPITFESIRHKSNLLKLVISLPASQPVIKSLPNELQLQLNQKLQLRCLLAGKPTPRVTWYKDGALLLPNKHIKLKNGRQDIFLICWEFVSALQHKNNYLGYMYRDRGRGLVMPYSSVGSRVMSLLSS